jgi:hypothetical protein
MRGPAAHWQDAGIGVLHSVICVLFVTISNLLGGRVPGNVMIKENPDEGPSCTLAGRWYRYVTFCNLYVDCYGFKSPWGKGPRECDDQGEPDEGPSCTLAGLWYRCVTLCYFCVICHGFKSLWGKGPRECDDQGQPRRGAQLHTGRTLVHVCCVLLSYMLLSRGMCWSKRSLSKGPAAH